MGLPAAVAERLVWPSVQVKSTQVSSDRPGQHVLHVNVREITTQRHLQWYFFVFSCCSWCRARHALKFFIFEWMRQVSKQVGTASIAGMDTRDWWFSESKTVPGKHGASQSSTLTPDRGLRAWWDGVHDYLTIDFQCGCGCGWCYCICCCTGVHSGIGWLDISHSECWRSACLRGQQYCCLSNGREHPCDGWNRKSSVCCAGECCWCAALNLCICRQNGDLRRNWWDQNDKEECKHGSLFILVKPQLKTTRKAQPRKVRNHLSKFDGVHAFCWVQMASLDTTLQWAEKFVNFFHKSTFHHSLQDTLRSQNW